MHRKCYLNITETFEHREQLNLLTETSDLSTIGGKLKYHRLKANMLQDDLATLSGIHVCTIKRLENDQVLPELETCNKLAIALNISPSQLYDEYLQFISTDYPFIIRAIRKKLNLKQDAFAKLIRVSKKTLSSWERGIVYPRKASYETLKHYIPKKLDN